MRKKHLLIAYSSIIFIIILIGYNFSHRGIIMGMDNFSKSSIDKKLRQDMIKKNIWSSKCPVSLDRLNLLKLSYVDFDGNEHHDGSMIVLDVVSDHVINIFKELFEKKFPISSIHLINEYNGNDKLSMENNNSSAFNCRLIENSNIYSIHSYGLAIDINPQQNPYLLTNYEINKNSIPIYPSLGMEYVNRKNIRSGMVETIINAESKQTVIDIFHKNGFTIWGGNWNDPIDWHHFQLTRDQSNILIRLNYEDGSNFFNEVILPNKQKINNY